PNLNVYRPADGYETAYAWGAALERTDGPSALLLTRQKVPPLTRAGGEMGDVRRGGYRVVGDGRPDLILAATGSEVSLAIDVRRALAEEGRDAHVVSIPCLEILNEQDPVYRAQLFPREVPVVTLEAGRTAPWKAIGGRDGLNIGIDRFGASAPADVLAEKFGLTVDSVVDRIRRWGSARPSDS
ncbi:MAG: transketolase, partial [Planctomycetota bacterium]|nr:transketolase [Planctomycetota bacterium]